MNIRAVPCGQAGCYCESWTVTKDPPQSFEQRVVALAKVLIGNAPNADPYTWSDALSDATDIIIASQIGDCTCD